MKHMKLILGMLVCVFGIKAVVTWEGTKTAQVQIDGTIVSVANQDLYIDGDAELPLGTISITATSADVNVYFVGGPNPADTTIRANDAASNINLTRLDLIVSTGRKIIFHIDPSNIRFRGTNEQAALPIIVNVKGTGGGSGEVWFAFEQDHKTLQFTAKGSPASGGCEFYIERTAINGAPTVRFITPYAANKIFVGPRSKLAMKILDSNTDSTYQGFIFDATNAPGNDSFLVFDSFCSIGLQTVND